MEAQQAFDELVAKFGAEAVIAVVKGHVHPDSGGDCQHTGCPPHYICAPSGNCQLDLG